MIEISENAIPRMVGDVRVIAGKMDGKTVYVASRNGQHAWAMTPESALEALK